MERIWCEANDCQVYHRRRCLPLPTELEVTENFVDFWVSLFHIRNLIRCLIRTLPRNGCCDIYDGNARRHFVRDADSCDRIAKQRRQLCGYIVAGRSGHGACVTKHAIPHIKNNHAPPTISFVNGINQTIRNPSMRSFRDLFFSRGG